MRIEETRAIALDSIQTALKSLNQAGDALRSARGWAAYDLWFGGYFASSRKREEIRRTQGHVRSAGYTINLLRADLERLDLDPIVGPRSGPVVVWGDVWFDNIVSDALTKRRLKRLDAELQRISRELVALQSRLRRLDADCSE